MDSIIRWVIHSETEDVIAELNDILTPLEQQVFNTYFLAEKSIHETAQINNFTKNVVTGALQRIRKKASSLKLIIIFLVGQFIY